MEKLLDIYTDYLHASFGPTTATGLSRLLDEEISHDKFTRMLSSTEKTSKDLWLNVKPLVRKYENDDSCLSIDDCIIEKLYTDENDLICWHYDHSKGRSVKGINLLTAFYHTQGKGQKVPLRIPIAFETIKKTIKYQDPKTGKEKRRSRESKNEMMRSMIQEAFNKELRFKYVLADSWFSSKENISFIHKAKKFFIFDIKQNRLVTKSANDQKNRSFVKISDFDIPEHTPLKVWLKDISFCVLLIRQVFTNKDGSTGVRYLVSNDLSLTSDDFKTIYKKRWSVEEYHKSLKQNNAVGKSPTRTITTQTNHMFASIIAYVKLEKYKLSKNMSHFAIKAKIYHKAIKAAFEEVQKIKKKLNTVATA
jgi:hypothetical protein